MIFEFWPRAGVIKAIWMKNINKLEIKQAHKIEKI